MFVVVYEFRIKDGSAEAFRTHWATTTQGILREYGSLGSRLHATADPNVFLAYAQWKSREQWQSPKNPLSDTYFKAREKMGACLESSSVLYELTVLDDLLQPGEA